MKKSTCMYDVNDIYIYIQYPRHTQVPLFKNGIPVLVPVPVPKFTGSLAETF